MIGCYLIQRDPQERPDAQRIRSSPGHPPLTVDALEIPHHQQLKVDARQSRPTQRLGIKRFTHPLYERIKLAFV